MAVKKKKKLSDSIQFYSFANKFYFIFLENSSFNFKMSQIRENKIPMELLFLFCVDLKNWKKKKRRR